MAAIKEQAQGVTSMARNLVHQVADPSIRQKYYTAISNFAKERPYLFFLSLTHVLFSATPLLLFLSFAASTAIVSLTAATLFALFWITIASFVLLLALFISISIGMTVWVWGVGGFIVAKWVHNRWNESKINGVDNQALDEKEVSTGSVGREARIK
ncbi:hypothetical protein K3495_g13955 [Podosphaera aphanis]|nr:hypothetical protein K3495_g13955 [Podosphaera aphanis]